jgi:hypothetical protein
MPVRQPLLSLFFRQPTPALARFFRSVFAVAVAALLCQCSSTRDEVYVSVPEQRMGVYSEGRLVKQYVISTSKFGLGDEPGTYRTPLGKHEIVAKIGHGLPTGAVLKSRRWNGEVLKPNAPGRDPIVSRIMWLRGMESSNRNAYKRYIYIHGTTEESRLGTPASYGCIRMGMKDVVELFEDLPIGAKVVVTKGALPRGDRKKEVQPEGLVEASEATTEGEDGEEPNLVDSDEAPLDVTETAAVKAIPIPVPEISGDAADGTGLPAAIQEEPKKKRKGWLFKRSKPEEPAEERTIDEDADAAPKLS